MHAVCKKEGFSIFGQLESWILDMNKRKIESLSEEKTEKIKIDIK